MIFDCCIFLTYCNISVLCVFLSLCDISSYDLLLMYFLTILQLVCFVSYYLGDMNKYDLCHTHVNMV